MKPTTKVLMMSHIKEKDAERKEWSGDRSRDRSEHERDRKERHMPRSESDYWIEGNTARESGKYMPWPEMNRYNSDYEPVRPRIGFAAESTVNYPSKREMMPYGGDEMSYRTGRASMGHAESDGYMPFTKEMADTWMKNLSNEDGSRGAHWTLEQTKQLQAQKNIDCDPIQFWAAMNMVYSDYFKVAKKHGVGNNIDFYIEMAKAFLEDKDARPDKISRYFSSVVQA